MNLQRRSRHGQWSNRLVYIGAVAGASVGLGSVWKFPQLMAEHGGGAFLLLYFSCVLMIALPLMAAEMLLGRRGRGNPWDSYRRVAAQEGGGAGWALAGAVAVAASLLVLAGYGVIGGWSLAYVFRAAAGSLRGLGEPGAQELFRELTQDPERLLAWHTLFLVMAVMVAGRGVRHGLEEAVRWLWPALLLLLAVLLAVVARSEAFLPVLVRLFALQPEQLSLAGLYAAAGHAFFSFGLGLGVVTVLSAYMDDRIPVLTTCGWIAVVDTLFGLAASVIVVALLQGADLALQSGPALVFEALPQAFGRLDSGAWVGTLFYLLLLLCAWTSAVFLLEPAVALLVERWRLERHVAAGYVGILAWAIGLGGLLSFNLWSHLRPLAALDAFADSTLFDLLSFLAARVLLPLSALLLALFVGWQVSRTTSRLELGDGADWRVWLMLLRFVTPPALLIIGARALL